MPLDVSAWDVGCLLSITSPSYDATRTCRSLRAGDRIDRLPVRIYNAVGGWRYGNGKRTIRTYHNPMLELKWSPAEKRIARTAFEIGLENELEKTINQAKQRMAKVTEASELWDLEAWLSNRRRQIDQGYDYRYSVLPEVFATLIHRGELSEDDLAGLGADKIEMIRKYLTFGKRDCPGDPVAARPAFAAGDLTGKPPK